MKIIQDINGNRELSETYLPNDVVLKLKVTSETNEPLLINNELVTYLNVIGWNESKQKFIKISAINSHTGEDLDKDSIEILQSIQSIQINMKFLTEDLKEEAWGYIESFSLTSYKDKCLISFNRYDDEERDKEVYANVSSSILDTSKAICIEKIENSKIVLNYYE